MKGKGKVLFAVAICLAVVCMLFVGCNNKKENVVGIKPAKTIEIGTADELLAAAQYVGIEYKNYTLKLTANIDLTGKEWKPIGPTLGKAFCGTFDGNHKTINGLTVTGWDEYGKPLYIAKQVIGWLEDGTPVYKSSAIIDIKKGEEVDDGVFAVNGIVREGDDEDNNYQLLADGKGTFEKDASYGSVGLFGYTKEATIKDLTVYGAELSFYTSGEFAYAGVVSGYDIASDFENVTVQNSTIALSNIYDITVAYDDNFGTPVQLKAAQNVKEYVGGVVGYAKSKTHLDNGTWAKDRTVLKNVSCESFVFDNVNYSAFFESNLSLDGDKADSRLLVNTEKEVYYETKELITPNAIVINLVPTDYPVQVYAGGLAGYLTGADIRNSSVTGFNCATKAGDGTQKLTNAIPILSRSMYVGGAVGGIYGTIADGLTVDNAFINGAYWKNWYQEDGAGLVYDKATFGGAVGEAVGSDLKNGTVTVFYAEALGDNLRNVCVGGFLGYEDGQTTVKDVSVNGMYAYSSYTGSGSEGLGSVFGGAVGVLRNSALSDASVSDILFEVKGQKEEAYSYARCLVSQAYGNSSFKNGTAQNVHIANARTTVYAGEYDQMVPKQYKNNIVNEDGNTSVRLYYSPDGESYSDVYVTVYGGLIPRDANDNLLHREDVYIQEDLSGTYAVGDALPLGVYYFYETETYKLVGPDTLEANKYYVANRLYARKTAVYRVEFAAKNAGATLQVGTYYEYDEPKASFTLTNDTKVNPDKTYYTYIRDEYVAAYYMDIKVYTESGNLLVVEEKDPDDKDDDVLAEARYALTKQSVIDSVKTAVYGDTEYALAESEIYYNTYFEQGKGFKKDVNNFTITYFDQKVTNRNFAKYIFVSGRPVVDIASLDYVD